MKTSLLVLLLAALLAPVAGAQRWEKVNFPIPENITGLCFVNSEIGYAVTSSANIARTFDGGRTWQVARMPSQTPLEDVFFLNRDTGLACGRKGVLYRTVNGGSTWEDRSLGDTMLYLTSVRLLEPTVGLVLGLKPDSAKRPVGVLARSNDGGITWKWLPVTGMGFGEMFYRPGSPVCFQSWGQIHYSNDLGATWQTRRSIDGRPARATAFYGSTGIICGNSGVCAYSNDGGSTWNKVSADEDVHLTSAVLVNDKLGYIAGTGATILKTTDGGKTWIKETIPVETDFYCLCLVGNRLFAAGKNGQMIRTSAGKETAKKAARSK